MRLPLDPRIQGTKQFSHTTEAYSLNFYTQTTRRDNKPYSLDPVTAPPAYQPHHVCVFGDLSRDSQMQTEPFSCVEINGK